MWRQPVRSGIPVLIASTALSAGLFAFDHYWFPGANLKQDDQLRNEIKGRRTQSFLHPEQKWIKGEGPRIYYYKYLDAKQQVMAGVYVYELDPETFDLRGEIAAERAEWQPAERPGSWKMAGRSQSTGSTRRTSAPSRPVHFPQLTESPEYFLTEVTQDKQMNYLQLKKYIGYLRQRGFDTVRLRVQFYKKFSVPVFALIMAMIAIPFAFLVGNRGAMAGIGVSIAIAMMYWGLDRLFEQIGDVNQLDPIVAAWAPDAVFALAGMFFMMRMRS